MKVSKWSIWIESVLLYKIKARPSLLLFLMYSKPKKTVNVYKNGFIHAYGKLLNVLKDPIVLWSSWTTNRIICRKIWWSTVTSMIPRTHRTLTSFGHCMIMPTCPLLDDHYFIIILLSYTWGSKKSICYYSMVLPLS